MSNTATKATDNYRTYHDSVLRLHELFLQGKNNSEEAEGIRRETDEVWLELSDEEQETLSGLSADLVDVEEIKSDNVNLEPPRALIAKFREAVDLYSGGRLDDSLKLFRECKKLPRFSNVSYFRGRIWEKKGESKTAAVFLKHAVDLCPSNEAYWAQWMDVLSTTDPTLAEEKADEWLSNYKNISPIILVRACQVKFEKTLRIDNEETAMPLYTQIAEVLEFATKKLVSSGKPMWEFQPTFSLAYSILAPSNEHLRQFEKAYYCYTQAIGFDPANSVLLQARGKMTYGIKAATASSITDFRDSIRLGTELAIPYFFLAHYAIATENFEEALQMSTDGLQRRWTKRVKSELSEFKAIAQYYLLASHVTVRTTFQEAIQTDATNERAKKNLAAFEELVKRDEPPVESPWDLPMVDDLKWEARNVQFRVREPAGV